MSVYQNELGHFRVGTEASSSPEMSWGWVNISPRWATQFRTLLVGSKACAAKATPPLSTTSSSH